MHPDELPRLVIATVRGDFCTGRFDASPWVGENWIGGLYLGAGRFVWGRFRDVEVTECTCSFVPDLTTELAELHPGDSYPFMDGYWGERAELVLNEARDWQRTTFEPSDMVRFPAASGWMATRFSPQAPSGGEVVSGGWDHEHCEICRKTIGRGGEPEGVFSPPESWVCEECFTRYVEPRSIDFARQA